LFLAKTFGKEFKIGLRLRLRIFLWRILAFMLPLIFMINYLELEERNAYMAYVRILKAFEDRLEIQKK